MAFDRERGRLYASDQSHALRTFDSLGVAVKSYSLTKEGDRPRQVLAHPQGGRLLILSDGAFLWVEVP